MPDTRPRVRFNKEGVCNACQWAEQKRSINWEGRQDYFEALCDRFRRKGDIDCIVPWSGGKDSIYVAYKMREYGMHPLLMTIIPDLPTEIGEWNRLNMCPDFEHVFVTLSERGYRTRARQSFVQHGRPKHPWVAAISAVILQQAVELEQQFIIYGEDGEQEYGGGESGDWKNPVTKAFLEDIYYSGHPAYDLPKDEDFAKLYFTQWSRYEDWAPSMHANYAVSKGMRTEPVRHVATLTQSSQISDKLQDLHMYLCYLKFGFGRCLADTCIAIRDGWMKREEALEWVHSYDHELPTRYLQDYLRYFEMDAKEFWATCDTHVNLDIFKKEHEKWVLKEPVA